MDLKHLLSLYIAELEAAGDQSRDALLEQNPDLSGEINRFFQYLDRAKNATVAATIDVQPSSSGSAEFQLDQTVVHLSGSSNSAATHMPKAAASAEDLPGNSSSRSIEIGNYQLIGKIAEGGMGAVWLAEQLRPVRRRVALKLIKAGKDSNQIIARFDAERQALAMMQHQNIAKMLDAGQTDDGLPYFVMELVDGMPITHYCDQNCLSLQERLQLFIPICHAIQHAHQKGIIHRDLKPSNVLVTSCDGKPVVKVIDFGLAKAIEHETRLTEKTMSTEFGQIVGTLQYMSPEQAELSSLDVDTRTDIYALGVLLYELLTGSTPLEQSSIVNVSILKVLEAIRTQEPPRPSSRLSSSGAAAINIGQQRRIAPDKLHNILRGDLDWVVMKALEKDRARRYESASAFADDVQRYLNDEPLQARPPSAMYQTQKFVRKHRAAVIAAACMLGLLILGLTGTTIGLSRALSAQARESAARSAAETSLERAVQAESLERQRSTELKLRSEELEKLTQFQQNEIRSINASKMGSELRTRLIKDHEKHVVSGMPSSETMKHSEAGNQPSLDLQLALSHVNFTDLAIDALRSNIFLPAFETVKKDYADQPAFQAKMLLTLAETMRSKGVFDAEPIQLCVAIREKQFGPESAEAIEAQLELAHLLSEQGKLSESKELSQRMLDVSRRALGSEHQLTQQARGIQAVTLKDLGQFEESEKLHRENLAIRKKLYPLQSDLVGKSMMDLASALRVQRKYAESEELYRQLLSLEIAQRGDKSRETYNCKHNLAIVLFDQGKYEESRTLDEEVVAGFRELLGELHPDTAAAINSLAGDHFALGHLDVALELYRRLQLQLQETVGAEHPHILLTASNTALTLKELGKLEESALVFRDVIARQRRVLGSGHPMLLKTLYELGGVYYLNEQFDQAEAWFREYVTATGNHNASCLLINCLLMQRKVAEAQETSAEILRRAKQELPDRPNDLATFMGEVAQMFFENEQYEAAKPILQEAQRLFIDTNDRTSDGASDVDTMLSIIAEQKSAKN